MAYSYDGEGRQLSRTDKVNGSSARVTSHIYNPAGTVQLLATTSYEAGTNRLLSCNFAQGADPVSGYDPDQNLIENRAVTVAGAGSGSDVTDCNSGTLQRRQSFSYNEPGWVTASTQQVRSPETGQMVERSQSFTHGPDGQVSSASLATPGAQSFQASFDYTAAGWAEKTTDWRNKTTSVSYLASGTPRSQTVGSGVATATFDWHPEGSPKELTWKNSSGLALRQHKEISYDLGGLRTSEDVLVVQPGAKSPGGAKATYTYDLADRLTSWTSPFVDVEAADRLKSSYSLDDAGNITTETVTKATSGLQASRTTYSYQNTRLSRRDGETAGVLGPTVGTDTYSYNGLGQETLRQNTAGNSAASAYDPMGHHQAYDDRSQANQDVTYVYDAQDQVVSRHEPGAPPERAKATVYFHDAATGALLEEADGQGNTLVRYLNDSDADPIAQQGYKVANGQKDPSDTAGTWKWLLPDVNASVATHLLDSGEVAEQAAWDPYGRPEKAGSSVTDQTKKGSTLGFQGAITHKVTGNLLLGPRQYDPGTARFLTPDTFVAGELDLALGNDALTGNRYLFAAANPVAYFDDGHWPWRRTMRRWVGMADGGRQPETLITKPAPRHRPAINLPADPKLNRPLITVPGPSGRVVLINKPLKGAWERLVNVPSGIGQEILRGSETNTEPSRRRKIRLAKQLGRVPVSEQPIAQGQHGKQGKPTRWWEYTDSLGQKKIVVEHPDGSVHVGTPKPHSSHRQGGPPKYYPQGGTGHVGDDL